MSRLRLLKHLLASSGGGGGGVVASYDSRFGTGNDANNMFTFGLHSGNKRIWVDAVNGLNTNNGLTAATAKQTWAAATALFTSGYVPGDQLMVATGTYTDTGSSLFAALSGISLTYPLAVLSYDPADAANSAKYGKLVGAAMPILNVSSTGGTNTFDMAGGTGANYLAVQGLELNANGLPNVGIGYSGVHNGIAYQNCRFNGLILYHNGDSGTSSNSVTINVSKCSFWGAWDGTNGGNQSGLLCGLVDGTWIQDNVFVHCGWRIGQDRDAAGNSGGAVVFGHGYYYSAHALNGRADRNVCVDSAADGHNWRGSIEATTNVAIDEPIAFTLGGYSASYTENPAGALTHADDLMAFGGADTNAGTPRGILFHNNSTQSGSYARTIAVADCPVYGGGNSKYLGGSSQSPSCTSALLIDKLHSYGYAPALGNIDTSTYPGSVTWTNDIIDLAITNVSNNVDGGGNSVSNAGTFPSLINRVGLMTAMGYSGSSYPIQKAKLLNDMLGRPDQPWAPALMAKGAAALGLTPLYPTAAVPTAGTVATIFGTSIGTMAFSATTFVNGTPASGAITGVPTGWMVWSTNLPSGLTINSYARTWAWSGTGTVATSTFTLKAGLTKTEPVSQTINYTIS